MPKKAVILNGAGSADQDLAPILETLSGALEADGAEVETFTLRDARLAHCLGCFGCWIKTPGMCVEADAGRDIARAMVHSDVAVLFTPVTFGGYSPELKRMVDRFIQLALPFFQLERGEVHHPPRYARPPRLLYVGVQRCANPHEARIFKTLAGRNAINFHPPGYAAEVVSVTDDAGELRARFTALLTRCDPLPFGNEAASLMPWPVTPGSAADATASRRALLLVGSPKTSEPSASNILGSYLIEHLRERGWESETLTLRAGLHRPDGAGELLAAVRRAGTMMLACPLYVDSLPHLVTKALTLIARDRQAGGAPALRMVTILNSGFPETFQNSVAMAICREFAAQSGINWAGGLALGGGGVVTAHPLSTPQGRGSPVRHIVAALDQTAAALAQGLPVPAEAARLMAKSPLPMPIWRRFYLWMGGRSFEKLAAPNGVTREQLRGQPYMA
jgi:multimeric flavodoxin WrbA